MQQLCLQTIYIQLFVITLFTLKPITVKSLHSSWSAQIIVILYCKNCLLFRPTMVYCSQPCPYVIYDVWNEKYDLYMSEKIV